MSSSTTVFIPESSWEIALSANVPVPAEQEGRADVESQSADVGDDECLHTGLLGRGRHVVADEAPGAHAGDLEENELADDGGAVGETRMAPMNVEKYT